MRCLCRESVLPQDAVAQTMKHISTLTVTGVVISFNKTLSMTYMLKMRRYSEGVWYGMRGVPVRALCWEAGSESAGCCAQIWGCWTCCNSRASCRGCCCTRWRWAATVGTPCCSAPASPPCSARPRTPPTRSTSPWTLSITTGYAPALTDCTEPILLMDPVGLLKCVPSCQDQTVLLLIS